MKLTQFEHYIGYFEPKLTDIKEEAKADIGRLMIVQTGWKADERYSNGKYSGQWVLLPIEGSTSHLSFPEEDFRIVAKL